MPSIVYKFGGTSLGSAECIRAVCDIIHKDKPNFVVVSAIAGVTDMLESFCSRSEIERQSLLEELKKKHETIVRDLNIAFPVVSWTSRLLPYVHKHHLSAVDKANILALGEDLSASLVQAVCLNRSLNIQFLEAREIILTDNNYNRATPNLTLMKKSWEKKKLSLETSYITQGFIGASRSGDTTVLGRGGSDYTAALLAEICDANEVRIYTDVDGIYTMDPKIIEKAQRIPELSFEEMKDLAHFGAKVLYAPMLSPCMRAGIPIFVTSTFNPSKGGTWIYATDKEVNCKSRIKALSLRQNQSLCSIDYSFLGCRGLDDILQKFQSFGIFPVLMTTQDNIVAFVLDDDDVSQEQQQCLLNTLSTVGIVRLYHDLALITMVGSGLSSPQIISTITEKLKVQPGPVFCCCQSAKTLSFVVSMQFAESIIEQLHNDYVKQNL
ncbi:aspartate kinase [Chlamydia sp. 17-3921]|uniref:aspartate kinase n=1 Tax=Chlamydia sp. 17-3921 TaxID=2675798 RepID=UPI001918CD37|nr:aspartate kinase [Chlamydia sp. 17-3921]